MIDILFTMACYYSGVAFILWIDSGRDDQSDNT